MKPRYVRVTTIRRVQMGAVISMVPGYAPNTSLDKIRDGVVDIALITVIACKEACQ